MPDVGTLTRQKPTQATIDLGDGDTVALVFDRNRVTPAWIAEAERRDNAQDVLSLPKALAEVLLEWDVTQDGQPFPPSAVNVAVFSYPAQRALLEQILSAAVPSSEEGNASDATSSTQGQVSMVPPVSLQNGPAPSVSPAPSTSPSPT